MVATVAISDRNTTVQATHLATSHLTSSDSHHTTELAQDFPSEPLGYYAQVESSTSTQIRELKKIIARARAHLAETQTTRSDLTELLD